jgi:hypothetical protein
LILGIFEGSLILSNCLTLLVHQYYLKDFKKTRFAVAKIIFIQRIDTTYDSVDFGDPMSIITYFKQLCKYTLADSQEEVDRVIDGVVLRIYNKEAKDDSIKFPGVKTLAIMRSTAKKIHDAFQELGRDEDHSTVKTAMSVLGALDEGLESLDSLFASASG